MFFLRINLSDFLVNIELVIDPCEKCESLLVEKIILIGLLLWDNHLFLKILFKLSINGSMNIVELLPDIGLKNIKTFIFLLAAIDSKRVLHFGIFDLEKLQ